MRRLPHSEPAGNPTDSNKPGTALAWTHFIPTGRLAAATAQGLRLFFKYETKTADCQVGDQKDQVAPSRGCERRARLPALTTLAPWRSLPREGLWASASFPLRTLFTSELSSPTIAA